MSPFVSSTTYITMSHDMCMHEVTMNDDVYEHDMKEENCIEWKTISR